MKTVEIEELRRSEAGFLGDGHIATGRVVEQEDDESTARRRLILSVMTRGMGTRDVYFKADTPAEFFEEMVKEGGQNGLTFTLPDSRQVMFMPAQMVRESLFFVTPE